MANVANVLEWAHRDLGRGKDCIFVTRHEVDVSAIGGTERDVLRFKIFTDNNEYIVSAQKETDKVRASGSADSSGYLGCVMSSRKPRAGETWTRGGDLPDGPLCEETWSTILKAIVRNELVKVHRPSTSTMASGPAVAAE